VDATIHHGGHDVGLLVIVASAEDKNTFRCLTRLYLCFLLSTKFKKLPHHASPIDILNSGAYLNCELSALLYHQLEKYIYIYASPICILVYFVH
jgi:hypothetical protein